MLSLFIIFARWFKPTEDKSAYFQSEEYRKKYPHGYDPTGGHSTLVLTLIVLFTVGTIFLGIFLVLMLLSLIH